MKELRIEANVDNLPKVLAFVDDRLAMAQCPMKAKIQMDIAVREVFVYIARNAYAPGTGNVSIRVGMNEEPAAVQIDFEDSGMPRNPLSKSETEGASGIRDQGMVDRGIFMVEKIMDEVCYEFRDGKNLLTIRKSLGPGRKRIMVAPRGN